MKLDWADVLHGPGNQIITSIAVDQYENIYITGKFDGVMDIDPSTGVYNLTATGSFNEDVFLVKYDKSGNLIWGFSLGGSSSSESGIGLTTDTISNTVFLTGYFQSSSIDLDPGSGTFLLNNSSFSFQETFIAKYDYNGNFLTGANFSGISGNCSNYPFSISKSISGNILIGGYFSGNIDFDPSSGLNQQSSSNAGMYLVKLNSSLNLLWVNVMDGPGSEFLYSVEQAKNGDAFIAGAYAGTVDFNPGVAVNSLTASGTAVDIFFAKYSTNGNYLWAHSIGSGPNTSDMALSISLDSSDTPIISGSFYGTVDFDPGVGIFNMSSTGNNHNGFFGKYANIDGSLLWVKAIKHSGSVRLRSVTISKENNILIWGEVSVGGSSIDIDPGPSVAALPLCGPLYMDFVGKYDEQGNYLCGNKICPGVGGYANFKDKIIRAFQEESVYTTFKSNTDSLNTSPCNKTLSIPLIPITNTETALLKFNLTLQGDITASIDTICKGDSITLLASGGDSYLWSTGSTDSIIKVSPVSTTTYYVIASSNCGCSVADTTYITVFVLPSVTNILNPPAYCDSAQVNGKWYYTSQTVRDTIYGATSGGCDSIVITNLIINNSQNTNQMITVCPSQLPVVIHGIAQQISGVYSQTFLGKNGCDSTSTITLVVNNSNVNTKELVSCDSLFYNGVWYYSNQTFSDTISGGSINGCDSIVVTSLVVIPTPSVYITPKMDSIYIGDFISLNAYGANNYFWGNNGSTQNLVVSPIETTTYCVVGTNINNSKQCSDTACVTVYVLDLNCNTEKIFIPTGISPNGDGVNDKLCVFGSECIASMTLSVYDRWGNNVFQTNDKNQCWDGTYKSQRLNSGVYVFYFEGILQNNQEISLKGNISLFR